MSIFPVFPETTGQQNATIRFTGYIHPKRENGTGRAGKKRENIADDLSDLQKKIIQISGISEYEFWSEGCL